jgi:hypothetical protein
VSRRPISRLRTSDRALGLRRNAVTAPGSWVPRAWIPFVWRPIPSAPFGESERLYTLDVEHAVDLPRRGPSRGAHRAPGSGNRTRPEEAKARRRSPAQKFFSRAPEHEEPGCLNPTRLEPCSGRRAACSTGTDQRHPGSRVALADARPRSDSALQSIALRGRPAAASAAVDWV